MQKKFAQGRKVWRTDYLAVFAVLNRVVGEDLNEKLTVEKRLEGGNGVNHANMEGEGREHSRWRHLPLQRI